jgi:hypothetical protein
LNMWKEMCIYLFLHDAFLKSRWNSQIYSKIIKTKCLLNN